MSGRADTEQSALEVRNLVKKFGDLTAVNQLSLQVKQGEVFGFLGPNGAGKTTSIQMMCGLLKPDAGDVYIHGKRVHHGNGAGTRSKGKYPLEQTYLF